MYTNDSNLNISLKVKVVHCRPVQTVDVPLFVTLPRKPNDVMMTSSSDVQDHSSQPMGMIMTPFPGRHQ